MKCLGLLMTFVVLADPAGASGRPGEIQWTIDAVRIEQALPLPREEVPAAGVGIIPVSGFLDSSYTRYRFLQMGALPEGDGAVVGLLDGEWRSEELVTPSQFGRTGNTVSLQLDYRPHGGTPAQENLPERLKRIAFTAQFPEDLPDGRYRFVVELRDGEGTLLQQHETEFERVSDRPTPLAPFTDEALLAEFFARGRALEGMALGPSDGGVRSAAGIAYQHPRYLEWQRTVVEINVRGHRMTPLLLEALEREAVRDHEEAARLGFASHLSGLLAAIDDERAIPTLLAILDGKDGRVNPHARLAAATALERMTGFSFVIGGGRPGNFWGWPPMRPRPVLEHRDALRLPRLGEPAHGQVLSKIAEQYRRWLAEEGRDPNRRAELARQRAMELLAEGDDRQVGTALLVVGDEVPEEAMPILVRRLEQLVGVPKQEKWLLVRHIASFGPPARQHLDLMLPVLEHDHRWSTYSLLKNIGGERVMARLVDDLPELAVDIEQRGLDPEVRIERVTRERTEDHQIWLAYNTCRIAIERWAGRTFETDDDIYEWWENARDQTQRQWLESHLDRTAAEADAGNARAQYIIRQMLPDLPNADHDLHFDLPYRGSGYRYRERPHPPFRVAWLNEHRQRLRYAEERSAFVLER